MSNMIIGIGNCGCQIVRCATTSPKLSDVKMYAIDSVTSFINLSTINSVKVIPIISDDKGGSGRNRERGKAMYKFHEGNGAFEQMYEDAKNSKSPVLVITSAAGGTGSGAVVPLCEALIKNKIDVIPIIICPNMEDPMAYHLNTNDLIVELGEIGVKKYSIFRNPKDNFNYTPINNEVVELINIVFGHKYDDTDKDSIDDSDLDSIFDVSGRFIAISASANNIDALRLELARKVFSGFQPAWTAEESEKYTFVKAFSLKSMFAAETDLTVFDDIRARIPNSYDEYKNIVSDDNNGICEATVIISGLPMADIKIIDAEFEEVSSLGSGLVKSKRPGFMNKKKASVTRDTDTVKNQDGSKGEKSAISKFNWK